jgi:hypothetical protein
LIFVVGILLAPTPRIRYLLLFRRAALKLAASAPTVNLFSRIPDVPRLDFFGRTGADD